MGETQIKEIVRARYGGIAAETEANCCGPAGADTSDVEISKCVINFVPDKQQGFRKPFGVFRRGGGLVVSAITNTAPLPAERQCDRRPAPRVLVSCTAPTLNDGGEGWLTG